MYALSKYREILVGIRDLAVRTHDDPVYLQATGQLPYRSYDANQNLVRDATKIYEVPTLAQMDAAGGLPFFAVRFGRLAGFGDAGLLQSADAASKGASATEPFWDWEVYSFHPYSEEDPNYDDAAQDLVQLFQAFQDPANERLKDANGNARCQRCYVADASPVYLELLSGEPFTAAYLLIRTAEYLQPIPPT